MGGKTKGFGEEAIDLRRVAAIVLGGGRGSRLHPLTVSRCKPAVCFGGHYRLIDVPISNALNAGCNKIYVLTQFLSSSLSRHISRTYRHDPYSQGFIDILPAEEKHAKHHGWFLGTADAVRQNLEYFIETAADYFLILSGDQLYNIDFREMLRFAVTTDAELTVAALPVCQKDAPRMGIMKINTKHKIVDFVEKPKDPELLKKMVYEADCGEGEPRYLASMGIYLFKRELLFKVLRENPGHDFGKDLIPSLVKLGKAKAFLHSGYWEDIGTIESFHKANIALTQKTSLFNFYDKNNPIYTHRTNLPGPKIFNTHLADAIVCEGSIVEALSIKNSILGPRTVVGQGTTILDSYVMGNEFYEAPIENSNLPEKNEIGLNCVLDKVIIDKHVRIGNNVRLVNEKKLSHYDSDLVYIRDGIIVVPRGVTLPDGFVL